MPTGPQCPVGFLLSDLGNIYKKWIQLFSPSIVNSMIPTSIIGNPFSLQSPVSDASNKERGQSLARVLGLILHGELVSVHFIVMIPIPKNQSEHFPRNR